jgi:hypothetical protein
VEEQDSYQKNDFVSSDPFAIPAVAGVILLIVLVHIGFSRTYIRFFPAFDGFTVAQHFHGAMMMGWLVMLLLQPVLILRKKITLHKQVGKLSYLLAPLVLFSIYWVIHMRYHTYLAQGGQTKAIVSWLFLNFRLMIFFAVLFFLAIYYKHRPALHMRFMCSTALVLIGPGLVRLLISYLEISRTESHSFDRNANVLIAALIFAVDSWRTRRVSPFILVLSFMVLQKIMWDLREAEVLQEMGRVIAMMF